MSEQVAPVGAVVRAALEECSTTCRAWPEQDEGPYHRPDPPMRRDVIEGAPGVPLTLGLRIEPSRSVPLTPATVEIWHCDALGRYSGFPPPSGAASADVADAMFLRGMQPVDDSGAVEFRTVYPGWYPGRTIHIHLRVHVDDTMFTSQLYFPERVNAEVLAQQPYATRTGRDTFNDDDSIAATGGGPTVVDVVSRADGWMATTCLLVPDGDGGRGRGVRGHRSG